MDHDFIYDKSKKDGGWKHWILLTSCWNWFWWLSLSNHACPLRLQCTFMHSSLGEKSTLFYTRCLFERNKDHKQTSIMLTGSVFQPLFNHHFLWTLLCEGNSQKSHLFPFMRRILSFAPLIPRSFCASCVPLKLSSSWFVLWLHYVAHIFSQRWCSLLLSLI